MRNTGVDAEDEPLEEVGIFRRPDLAACKEGMGGRGAWVTCTSLVWMDAVTNPSTSSECRAMRWSNRSTPACPWGFTIEANRCNIGVSYAAIALRGGGGAAQKLMPTDEILGTPDETMDVIARRRRLAKGA